MWVTAGAAANRKDTNSWLRSSFCAVWILFLAGCTPGLETEPLVEFSTELRVDGETSPSLSRPLRAGIYLIEIRERDIDLRIGVDADNQRSELADAFQRHGLHRTVVSLAEPAEVNITLASIDQRNWRGAAAVRILRWPQPAADAPPDQRLLGYMALGKANALIARNDSASWLAAIAPLRQAAAHFAAANEMQALAESEYQRSAVELNLLHEYMSGRRTAESAEAHFAAADDPTGEARASVLCALNELRLASEMGPEVLRKEQLAMLDGAVVRLQRAEAYFVAHDLPSDATAALYASSLREQVLGEFDAAAPIYQAVRTRAQARGDRIFEVRALQSLAFIASRQGNVAQSVTMLDGLLPHIARDRNPELYASLISDLGSGLMMLGNFDRAQSLHTEALELFTARGDEGQTARELTALASIQFRTGNVEKALATIESALPLYERARNQADYISALRAAGNAAAELGRHDVALDYLRRAEERDTNGITIEQTRVLIAGELRAAGNLRGAERLLSQLLLTDRVPVRAAALAERARLRKLQGRDAEALVDLREADSIYAGLHLDFDRIDTSSALAMELLAAGDVKAASVAADTAVEIEKRIRVSSANPEVRARFLSASYAPYEARIEADLAAVTPTDRSGVWDSFRVAEAIRARSLADRLASAQNAPSSAGIADSLLAVQTTLPADTAVLAYFVGDHRSHGWLLSRSDLRHSSLPGRRELDEIVDAFVRQQRDGGDDGDDAASAVLLGNLLNGVNARRLLVLPDGPMNSLPFAALPMPHGRAHEMLVDRFVLSSAPSLALALQPGTRATARHTRVAVVSDPIYTPDDRRLTVATYGAKNYRGAESATEHLARLPYSAIEARAVVRAFSGMNVIELAGFNATARRVMELPFDELGVLHFATHAIALRDAPEQSALFLSEFAADGSPLASDRLTLEDIARSGLRADIVVLSGCATGDGRELRGEGVIGLTYGFLANGSHTVVASLWPVEDALTARFMEDFYAAYRTSGNAPQALRIAQLRARGASGPAVWSSFVVRANALP